jgi:hypothetical protein
VVHTVKHPENNGHDFIIPGTGKHRKRYFTSKMRSKNVLLVLRGPSVTELARMGVFQRNNSHGVYLEPLMHEPNPQKPIENGYSFFGVYQYQFSLFL